MHDYSQMPFGKYLGKRMIEIPSHYLLWLFDRGCDHPGVKKYILNNMSALKNEVANCKSRKRA